jgi:nucleoside phosphorylase
LQTDPWARIAYACAFVIGIIQRGTGLWAYPTHEADRTRVYSASGTAEALDRLNAEFGFESLTVTWNALEAESKLFSQLPRADVERALSEIERCRTHHGAFGSRSTSYQGPRTIPSTRHTALAVLAVLSFSRPGALNWSSLELTTQWLLEQQTPKHAGGWAFDESTADKEEPMSTASCVAALSCLLDFQLNGSSFSDQLKNDVIAAIRNGFNHLMARKAGTLWTPRYPETHVSDNAFILDMLDVAIQRGKLRAITPDVSDHMSELRRRFLSWSFGEGWPAAPDTRQVSLPATICVRCIIDGPEVDSRFVNRADLFVAREILRLGEDLELRGWDWIMLGRVAAKHHILSDRESHQVLEDVASFRSALGRPEAFEVTLTRCPPEARHVGAYLLKQARSNVTRSESNANGSDSRRVTPRRQRNRPPLRAIVVTALEVERKAVSQRLVDISEVEFRDTRFLVGKFDTWEVAVAEVGAGNARAGIVVDRAIHFFDPQVALFVGVAGGFKDVSIGDVVVADKVYKYESGKEDYSGLNPIPITYLPSYALIEVAKSVRSNAGWHSRLQRRRRMHRPRLVVGAIAAGEKVVGTSLGTTAKLLKSSYGDTVAIEMEGAGFLDGVGINPSVKGCIIRGISDLLDGKAESDESGSQELAADAASAAAFELLARFRPSSTSAGQQAHYAGLGN